MLTNARMLTGTAMQGILIQLFSSLRLQNQLAKGDAVRDSNNAGLLSILDEKCHSLSDFKNVD